MEKWIIIILLMMCVVPLVSATTIFQISEDNITFTSITQTKWGGVIDEGNNVATVQNLDECTTYYFRAMSDFTSWKYTEERTVCSGEKVMASLAVLGFVVLMIGGIFYLSTKQHSENVILSWTIKYGLIMLGLFLLTLATTMALTISNTFGVGVNSEMTTILWLVSKTAYVAMFIVTISFTFKTIAMFYQRKQEERMGG